MFGNDDRTRAKRLAMSALLACFSCKPVPDDDTGIQSYLTLLKL